MCSEQIQAKYLNIFLLYKHLLWVRLTVPTRKVIAYAVEKLLTQLFSTVLKVLSSTIFNNNLAINPKNRSAPDWNTFFPVNYARLSNIL